MQNVFVGVVVFVFCHRWPWREGFPLSVPEVRGARRLMRSIDGSRTPTSGIISITSYIFTQNAVIVIVIVSVEGLLGRNESYLCRTRTTFSSRVDGCDMTSS